MTSPIEKALVPELRIMVVHFKTLADENRFASWMRSISMPSYGFETSDHPDYALSRKFIEPDVGQVIEFLYEKSDIQDFMIDDELLAAPYCQVALNQGYLVPQYIPPGFTNSTDRQWGRLAGHNYNTTYEQDQDIEDVRDDYNNNKMIEERFQAKRSFHA